MRARLLVTLSIVFALAAGAGRARANEPKAQPRGASPEAGSGPGRMYGGAQDVRREPTVIAFGATWCNPCRLLHDVTFRDPEVIQELGAFRAIDLDVDDEPDVAKKYGVRMLPTIVFVDRSGEEIARIHGYVTPKRFRTILKTIALLVGRDRPNEEIRRALASL